MDCEECAVNLTAFLDKELSSADSDQVRNHLSICSSCANELRSLQEAADFIESHNRELEPRVQSWNSVRTRISTADSFSPFRFWAPARWRIATAALAIVIAFSFGYLQYQRIQRKNLNEYMSQYIQDRETHQRPQLIFAAPGTNLQIEVPYADNPFVEVKATLVENPFRSEDR